MPRIRDSHAFDHNELVWCRVNDKLSFAITGVPLRLIEDEDARCTTILVRLLEREICRDEWRVRPIQHRCWITMMLKNVPDGRVMLQVSELQWIVQPLGDSTEQP